MQNMIKLEKLKDSMRYREMYAALSPNLGKMILNSDQLKLLMLETLECALTEVNF